MLTIIMCNIIIREVHRLVKAGKYSSQKSLVLNLMLIYIEIMLVYIYENLITKELKFIKVLNFLFILKRDV